MNPFNSFESLLLTRIQHNIPLTSQPFMVIGEELGAPENRVMQTLLALKKQGVIRNIAAIFNPQTLGYVLGLVAFRLPDKHIDAASRIINGHPGVSHNYVRDHCFNIWFTLAEKSRTAFEETVDLLARQSGARDYLILENEKVFKIGVKLAIKGGREDFENPGSYTAQTPPAEPPGPLEKEGTRLLQRDLPIVPRPFRALSESGGQGRPDEGVALPAGAQKRAGGLFLRSLFRLATEYGLNGLKVYGYFFSIRK